VAACEARLKQAQAICDGKDGSGEQHEALIELASINGVNGDIDQFARELQTRLDALSGTAATLKTHLNNLDCDGPSALDMGRRSTVLLVSMQRVRDSLNTVCQQVNDSEKSLLRSTVEKLQTGVDQLEIDHQAAQQLLFNSCKDGPSTRNASHTNIVST
jgi:hypothetical protein